MGLMLHLFCSGFHHFLKSFEAITSGFSTGDLVDYRRFINLGN
ncbi:unnamed protein product [Brugia timori]|uniref:Uncharacterized protein n=1 Tax=Brugia timori TaxID=42155 RepID=A0A0R3R677_9BILA|nr:unnamed protein product [Brugia timori]